jgi:hypothetical protein
MRQRFNPDLLDGEGEPFEIDNGNRPHLFSHGHYGEHDLDDVLEHDGALFEADLNQGGCRLAVDGSAARRTPLDRSAGPIEVRERSASETDRHLSGDR